MWWGFFGDSAVSKVCIYAKFFQPAHADVALLRRLKNLLGKKVRMVM